MSLGGVSSLKASSKEYCPANNFAVSQREQSWILDLHHYEIRNLGWMKPLDFWKCFEGEEENEYTSLPWAVVRLCLLLPLQLRFGGRFQLLFIFGFPEYFLLASQPHVTRLINSTPSVLYMYN